MFEQTYHQRIRVENAAFREPREQFKEHLALAANAAARETAAKIYDDFVTEYDRRGIDQS